MPMARRIRVRILILRKTI
uniref:Uncharacterized protein n=1 Tax=Rhizophora mucronata TaxID=61149 RepID=A0A2P2QIN0_RHIMU